MPQSNLERSERFVVINKTPNPVCRFFTSFISLIIFFMQNKSLPILAQNSPGISNGKVLSDTNTANTANTISVVTSRVIFN